MPGSTTVRVQIVDMERHRIPFAPLDLQCEHQSSLKLREPDGADSTAIQVHCNGWVVGYIAHEDTPRVSSLRCEHANVHVRFLEYIDGGRAWLLLCDRNVEQPDTHSKSTACPDNKFAPHMPLHYPWPDFWQ